MIRQEFNIKHYWKVIVYYDIDYNFFDRIVEDVARLNSPVREVHYYLLLLKQHKAKAITISSLKHKTSIVLFNKHNSKADYISSIVHEAEHIKQAMLDYYNIKDKGENPAYTIGYIVSKMYSSWKSLLCNC